MQNEKGRSMVEMLGVLAIIGILSAGALAGFNKAMLQHKLNKNTDQISHLLATAIFNDEKLKDAKTQVEYLTLLKSIGAFLWKAEEEGTTYITVTDNLQNKISFERIYEGEGTVFVVILNNSDFRTIVCHNYINIFKNLATELDMLDIRENIENGGNKYNKYFGKVCPADKCLSSITNTDIADLCGTACSNANRCVLYAYFGFPENRVKSWY